MRTIHVCLSAILAVFLLTGCYETKKEFTFNPDGSGKVTLEAVFQLQQINLVQNDRPPDEKLKAAVRNLLEDSEGVETWRDVSFKMMEDDRVFFKGTAFFRNVADLKFYNLGDTKIKFGRNQADNLELAVEFEREEPAGDGAAPVDLSEEEMTREIAKQRARYREKMRPMMLLMMQGLKEEMSFHVPGTLRAGSHLKTTENGTLSFVFEGSKVIAAMDRLIGDDAVMRRAIAAGDDLIQDGPPSDEDFEEMVFGMRPPYSAELTGPFQPLFDYEQEVAAARKNYAAMGKALGIVVAIPTGPPPEGSGFTDLRVGGVRFVKFSDLERGIRPFNYDAGYTLALIGTLPGPVISLEEGVLREAIADTGADLLPEREWDRKINFPSLSADKRTAVFDVNLALPDERVRGIKKVAGTITYLVASGTREADLGISEFKAGSRGTEFGAVIGSVGESKWSKGQTMSIELALPSGAIKEIDIYDAAGNPIKLTGTSISSNGNQTVYSKDCETKFPARGRIVATVYEEPRKYEIPFALENISLLGEPLH